MRAVIVLLIIFLSCGQPSESNNIDYELIQDPKILAHEVDLKTSQLNFYYKDENGSNFRNHKNLREWLARNNQELIFAVNGGMYHKDLSPQGLYIERRKVIKKIDNKEKGYGNFYLQPNGIFFIDQENQAKIVKTDQLKNIESIKYATQSGPMLIIDGAIHSKFTKGSKNTHIRNGVGVLPNGNLLFAMSKEKINFYDFANYFKLNNCENALYLDGFVSRTYLPSKNWIQEDGNFGVIIGEIR